MSVRSVFPLREVFQSATLAADRRTSRRRASFAVGRPWRVHACVRARKRGAVRCGCVRAGMRTGREEGGKWWEPRRRKRRCARAARPPRVVGAACVVMHKGKGAVCVQWCGEDRGQR